MRSIAVLGLLTSLTLADTAVLRDRTMLTGAAQRTGRILKIAGRSVPLERVLLWEDDDGLPQHAPTLTDHVTGLRAIAERRVLGTCLERLPTAVEAKDGDVAGRLLARAVAAGLPAEEIGKWSARADVSGGESDAAVPGDGALVDVLAERALAILEENEEDKRGLSLLREALRRDANHEKARNVLLDFAPMRWRVGYPKDDDIQRIWLDWQIDVVQPGMRAVGWRQPDVRRAGANPRWKVIRGERSLHGAQTQEITFVTAMTDSSVVGMCTKYAWITCKALDGMFATEKPLRDDNLPLVIWFFENKKQYLDVNAGQGGQRNFLAMTAGFYSPTDNISRFFWPTNRPAPARAVRDTFVHELTHHWIQRRNPRLDPADLMRSFEVPGYWIVEGFATFIEEGRYDIRTNEKSHFNAHANSIDIVADLAEQGKLIAWDKLYKLSQRDFRDPEKLSQRGMHAAAKKRWAIRPQPLAAIRLFYEQSAATCHFLYWGENGRYRDLLLDYVTSYYTAKENRTSIPDAFGMSEKELGEKVEKWCKAVIDGSWRPPGE